MKSVACSLQNIIDVNFVDLIVKLVQCCFLILLLLLVVNEPNMAFLLSTAGNYKSNSGSTFCHNTGFLLNIHHHAVGREATKTASIT